ncbi:N-acetylgalactosamine-6-sulfatase [Labilibacter sediminis]|nr:N-acetylgalactosamine-6-sulfatase [Labilibacter sediminis]
MNILKPVLYFMAFLLVVGCTKKSSTDKSQSATQDKPNIILIVTDDQGWADVGYQGATDIPTPYLDKLATEGIQFSSGYVSHPYCAPSRAGILTGCYQAHFGFNNNPPHVKSDTVGVSLDKIFLPEVLKANGYKTCAIGKWHLGDHEVFSPRSRGFDHWFGFSAGAFDYWGKPKKFTGEGEHYNYIMRNDEVVKKEEISYLTDDFTHEAIDFVSKNQEDPFFLYLAYNAPHSPDQVTSEYLKLTEYIEYGDRSIYAAMVASIDKNVQKLDEQLIDLGLKENTIIIFLSDNGGRPTLADNRPFRGHKGMVFEGGIRVPFFVNCPKRFSAQKYEQSIISLDLFPTILNWCNIQQSDSLITDGVDLNSYLSHPEKKIERTLFWMSGFDDEYAVRKGRYKLVYAGLTKGKSFLFDVVNDPGERNDLSERKPEIKAELQAEFDQWVKNREVTQWEDWHVIKSKERTEKWNKIRRKAASGEKHEE